MRIREIALDRPRFGFQRIHIVLRREGWKVNRKRVHRLYRLEGRNRPVRTVLPEVDVMHRDL